MTTDKSLDCCKEQIHLQISSLIRIVVSICVIKIKIEVVFGTDSTIIIHIPYFMTLLGTSWTIAIQ